MSHRFSVTVRAAAGRTRFCPARERFRRRAVVFRRASLDQKWHDVEIEKAICRIEDFHVPADGAFRLRERFPIESPHAFVESLADRLFRFKPKQFTGGVVHISDAALRVGHNNAFLDRVENRLDQSLFLCELEEIILHLLRTDAAETLDRDR